MKRFIGCIAALVLTLCSAGSEAQAVGNFSVGLGPVGNIYVVDSNPQLDPGIGGTIYFDYRWSPQFSTQFGLLLTSQDGAGITAGDNNILLLGIPTFDLKFFLLSSESRWDPYGLIGMGFYLITEGSVSNGTMAAGIGADLGLGLDYYLTEHLSLGLQTVYRSIGLIESTDGANNGTALFPFSLIGNVAWHW